MSAVVTVITVVMILCQGAFAVAVFWLMWTSRKKVTLKAQPGQQVISIKKLMATGGFDNERDLIDDALNFYEFMTEQAMKGNLVGYMDREKEFTQVLTKGMRWAKDVGRVTGAGEAT